MVSWEGATEVGDAIKVISTRLHLRGKRAALNYCFPRFTEDLLNCYDCRANDRNSNCIPLEPPPWFVSFRQGWRKNLERNLFPSSSLLYSSEERSRIFAENPRWSSRSSGKRVDNPVVLSRVWFLFCLIFETLSKRKLENRKGGWKLATNREISREESNDQGLDHLFLCNVRNICTSRLTSPRAEIERFNREEREEEEEEGKPGE